MQAKINNCVQFYRYLFLQIRYAIKENTQREYCYICTEILFKGIRMFISEDSLLDGDRDNIVLIFAGVLWLTESSEYPNCSYPGLLLR